jgi:hypothetical protein
MLDIVILLESHNKVVNHYKWLFFLTLGVLLANLLFSLIKSKKIGNKNSIKQDSTQDDYLIFNEVEKTLIYSIVDCSKNNQQFTVNEMNVVLGVKNKSIEIQKKVRTEAIIRINHKFNVNFNMDTVFIERVRSIEDRRYFNYYINDVNRKIFLNNL